MKKIAIIFPGIGYNVDKPLLYYSKKIMREHEFEIVDVSFEGISKKALSDHTAMVQAFADCSSQTEEQLKGIRFDDYDEICFISKSLGTVAASVYAAKHGLKVRQVYYTPLEQTFHSWRRATAWYLWELRIPGSILTGYEASVFQKS